ncbi:Arabinose operon regulatory protein [compost metagenome]
MEQKDIVVRNAAFSQHTQPFRHVTRNGLDAYLIRLQTEGSCKISVEGGQLVQEPAEVTFFRPGEQYDLIICPTDPKKPICDYYLICSGEWIDWWWEQSAVPRKVKITPDGRIRSHWQQLVLEKRRMDGGTPEIVTILVQTLFLLLGRAIKESAAYFTESSHLALRMRSYIEEHAVEDFRLGDVAKFTGLSVSRTVHLFKEHFGMSVFQYTQQIRMSLALELMSLNHLTLEQIAEQTGFGSYSFFRRLFKQQHGLSPGVYRKLRGMG